VPAGEPPATGARGSASACPAGRDTTAAKVSRQQRRGGGEQGGFFALVKISFKNTRCN